MNRAAWVFFIFLSLSQAWAWEVVVSDRVKVVYPSEGLREYALEVAREAEAALDVLEPLFGPRSDKVVLRLNDKVDLFNAYATPIPRRSIELLAPVPAGDLIDLRGPSITYLLLVHELTHTRQLTYTEKPGGRKPLRLGLVTELTAPLPPAWFVEGVATYMESRFTPGGRFDWAYTQGLLNSLFIDGKNFPDLADMSLYTYQDWPSGQTRYLLGVRFVGYLIEKHGWESILKTLQQYNGGFLFPPSFAAAWKRANGSSLQEEWRSWVGQERRRATAFAAVAVTGSQLAKGGYDPVVSPDGRLLAYQGKYGVWVMNRDGSHARRLARVRTQKLWWADSQTLVYSRYVREGDGVVSDVFALDANSGRETRLTRGLHARLAAPGPDGCFYYVRDRSGEPSSLRRLCKGEEEVLWRAAGGEHLVGLAVSPGGQIALSVWHGGVVDLALLEGGRLRYLLPGRLRVSPPAAPPDPCAGGGQELGSCYERNRYQHVSPTWDGDYALLFRADESGVWDLYKLSLPEGKVTRLSASLSGVFGVSFYNGVMFTAEMVDDGYAIVTLPALELPLKSAKPSLSAFKSFCSGKHPTPVAEQPAGRPVVGRSGCPASAPIYWRSPERSVRQLPYSPWSSLAPYGWLSYPAVYGLQPAIEVSVYGLDDTGVYSYRLSGGYSPQSTGFLDGAYAYLAAGVGAGVDLVGGTSPFGFTLRVGAWPSGRFSIEAGALVGVASQGYWDSWAWRGELEAGPVWDGGWRIEWSANARLGREDRDPWGYLKNGGYLGAAAGAVGADSYWRGYGGAAWTFETLSSKPTFEVAAGITRGVVWDSRLVVSDDIALRLRLRKSFKSELRTADGWLALERVTLSSGLDFAYNLGYGYGGEVGLYADSVWFYALPLSMGLRLGYFMGSWWVSVEPGVW